MSCCNYNAAPNGVQMNSCPVDTGYGGEVGACVPSALHYNASGRATSCACTEGINCASVKYKRAPPPQALPAPVGASPGALWKAWLSTNNMPSKLRAPPDETSAFLASVCAVKLQPDTDTFTMALTNLAAESDDMFSTRFGFVQLLDDDTPHLQVHPPPKLRPPPIELDWRMRGAVTSAKNQRRCGSCYVFAAIAVLEGLYARQSGELVSLAEQPLVGNGATCIPFCSGCKGGSAFAVLRALSKRDGSVFLEREQPYTATDSAPCKLEGGSINIADLQFGRLDFRDETLEDREYKTMQHLAAFGPIAISVGVPKGGTWKLYAGGLLTPPTTYAENPKVNHVVTLVGYTPTEWIIKNSWSDRWGDAGFVYVPKGEAWRSAVTLIRVNKQYANLGPWGMFTAPLVYAY